MSLESAFKRYMPAPIVNVAKAGRRAALNSLFWALDTGEAVLGRREPLTPPRRLMNVGSNQLTRSDFHKIGQLLFDLLVDPGGLKPDDRVLDVGCGIGRMAVPLTRYLSNEGSYDGFDIVPESIDWCSRSITPQFPRFRFHYADIFNTNYNERSTRGAAEYRFPFPDESFSFVFLTSVFTHMMIDGVENYLREIRRVLVPGGRCFATHFLLNRESERLIASGKSRLTFQFPAEHGRTNLAEIPEAAVAQEESHALELYGRAGLAVAGPIRYGSWSGRSDPFYQDIIVSARAR